MEQTIEETTKASEDTTTEETTKVTEETVTENITEVTEQTTTEVTAETRKKKKTWIIISIAILVCAIATIFLILKLNRYSLVLSVPEKTITLEYGVDEMPDITASCVGTLINTRGIPVETSMDGDIDFDKLGTYEVTFTAKYRNLVLSESRTIIIQDTLAPVIELVADPEYYTSPIAQYVEEGFTAIDNYDGDVTKLVIREEHDGIVTYTVTDSSGNKATKERTIVYKDVISPTITLTGGETYHFNVGQTFTEPGFTATDDVDGDITSNVTVEGSVDGMTFGTYTLSYHVSDASGNVCDIQRTVKVGDFSAPVISLAGEQRSYILVGSSYSEPGYSASDNIDGNITSRVSVSGSVDTSKMGRNTITYTVADAAGNTATASRSVFVYKKQAVANTINPGDKVVYLTFDDGPSSHTARLLDILDKYNVKATFFVTNQFPAYQYMIGETHRRGHTIALHTYSHNYASLYSSEDAYYNDLAQINDIVVAQTGVTPTIVRFPGGTNNTVSRRYCSGIMSTLAETLSYHGYLYCDWNVSSGDAGGATTAEQVAANVISGIQNHSVSNVLQHDIKGFSVEAVDEIIFWGLEHGYTFLPMDSTSPMPRFRPAN